MDIIYSLPGVEDPIDATVVAFFAFVAVVTWVYCTVATVKWWLNTQEVYR